MFDHGLLCDAVCVCVESSVDYNSRKTADRVLVCVLQNALSKWVSQNRQCRSLLLVQCYRKDMTDINKIQYVFTDTQLVEDSAISRNVAGSIPDNITVIFL